MNHDYHYPVGRYRLTFKFEQPVRSKEYLGVQFQRWINQLLRQLVCFTKASHCEGCFLQDRCTYALSVLPVQQYLFSFPWHTGEGGNQDDVIFWQETVPFELILIGDVQTQIAIYVYVLQKLFATKLKYFGAKGLLDDVAVYDYERCAFQSIWDKETETLVDSLEKTFCIPKKSTPTVITDLSLMLITPLKVNVPILNIYEFFRILIARVKQSEQHYNQVFMDQTISVDTILPLLDQIAFEPNLQLTTWKQFLHMQKKPIHFEGWLGEIRMTGVALTQLLPFFRLGEVLHLGRNTNLGLGHYQLMIKS